MSNFRFLGKKNKVLSLYAALALCVPLILLAQENKVEVNKKNGPNCQTRTADALFRDNISDGISSDGIWEGVYEGLNGSTVCLLTEWDYDFILGVRDKRIERETGIDRKVTLNFTANNSHLPPFNPNQTVDALIRVDEVLSDTEYTATKRLIMWFKVGRDDYRLVFDGLDDVDWVLVTQSGISPDRTWIIESRESHTARLEYDHRGKRRTVGYFTMPFRITVYETDKPPTCL